MVFSEFITIMFNHYGGTLNKAEYFLELFDTLISDAKTPEDMERVNNLTFNPFDVLKEDTLTRYFNGTIKISSNKLRRLTPYIDRQKFADYINESNFDSQLEIKKEFRRYFGDFGDEDIGDECAGVFLQIIEDILKGNEVFSPIITEPSTLGAAPALRKDFNPKVTNLPANSVYIKNGKIHIEDTTIILPKELLPPSQVTAEEEIYVDKLLAAYTDAMDGTLISKEILHSLPPKYQHHLKEQRINYFSAERINRFCRDSVKDGEASFHRLKANTYDYISEILWDDYDNGFKRLKAVLTKVVDSPATSTLENFENLIGSKEKKGICHFLANDGAVHWVHEDE